MELGSAQEKRLFLGIRPGPDTLVPCLSWSQQLSAEGQIRWSSAEKLHVTVSFFGETPVERLPNLISMLQVASARMPAFGLTFHEYCWAPPGHPPRMIWARFEKNEAFLQTVRRFSELYRQIDPSRQDRFSPLPHITLARISEMSAWPELPQTPRPADIEVRELVLWESKNESEGHVYTEIARFTLK
ncbi:MAG: RNA 2',3'-cyclic phosphodiesterase [Bacteroidetes bacterium]|nr:MAG: RNA 2',3'-cyclic phosphodiesterase [Bacteroidota bacterium]